MPVHSDSSVALLRRDNSHSAAARRSSTRGRNPRKQHISPASSDTYRRRLLLTQSIHRSNSGSGNGLISFTPTELVPLCTFPPTPSVDVHNRSHLQTVPVYEPWYVEEAEGAGGRIGRSASCCETQSFSKRPSCASVDCSEDVHYHKQGLLCAKRASLHRTSSMGSIHKSDITDVLYAKTPPAYQQNQIPQSSSLSLEDAQLSSFDGSSNRINIYPRSEDVSGILDMHTLQQTRPTVAISSETASVDVPAPTSQFLRQLGVRQEGAMLACDHKRPSGSESSARYDTDPASTSALNQMNTDKQKECSQAGSIPAHVRPAPHFTALIKAAHMLSTNDGYIEPNSRNVSNRLARFTRQLVNSLSFSRKHNDAALGSSVISGKDSGMACLDLPHVDAAVSKQPAFGVESASALSPPLGHLQTIEQSTSTCPSPKLQETCFPAAQSKPKLENDCSFSGTPRRLSARLAANRKFDNRIGNRRNVKLTIPTSKTVPFLPAMMAMPMLSPASASLSAEAVTATGTASSSAMASPLLHPSSAAPTAECIGGAFFDTATFDVPQHQPFSFTAPAVALCAHDMLCRLARARNNDSSFVTFGAFDDIHESPPLSLHVDKGEEWGLFISNCLKVLDSNQKVPSIDSKFTFINPIADSDHVPPSPGSSLMISTASNPSYVLPRRWFCELNNTELEKLHTLIAKGVPGDFRRQVWMECAGAFDLPPCDSALNTESIEEIELDLQRTAGQSVHFSSIADEDAAIRCLRWVLYEYASANPETGYCQGMNKIALGLLNAGLGAADSLALLRSLLDGGILPVNMFRSPMDAVQSDQLVLEKLVCRRLPQLSAHMQTDLGGVAPLAPVTVSWFLTLFFDCLPEPHRLRVWDMLFAHGYPIVFQTCLAILELNQEALLQCKTPVAFYAMLQDTQHTIAQVAEDDFGELAFSISRPWVSLREIEEIRQHSS